ncbi:response regulator of citrate/malate metabolism [Rhodoglobus vestalii]|uniref:Transcriptional regulatory protein n=1 Tax=Rhodoglobus vestalii TaxID=193384 RepID=A0A8H2PTV5_9MICO|nr:response regulator [Rhodoglobus vestalii]TQO18937.1 response regulator of citrate/malate metabolism [Rhodoglobus vestalii]
MNAPIRALIVDDDFAVAKIHHQFVDSHPAFSVVGEAHTGTQALQHIQLLRPDVVLLDVYLPDISGLDVLSQVRREHSRHIEFVAVTAARDISSVRHARAEGVRHYLVKPFTASALHSRLNEVASQLTQLGDADRGEPLDQHTVDTLLAGISAPRELPPKGLSRATLAIVTHTLAGAAHNLSASEVALEIGMSRVGARRYLEHLVRTQVAAVEPRYGSTGRPENRYRMRQRPHRPSAAART